MTLKELLYTMDAGDLNHINTNNDSWPEKLRQTFVLRSTLFVEVDKYFPKLFDRKVESISLGLYDINTYENPKVLTDHYNTTTYQLSHRASTQLVIYPIMEIKLEEETV